MIDKTPVKKEFITNWSRTSVITLDNLSAQQKQFFDHARADYSGTYSREMLHPDSIRFNELTPFFGRKTKITIEVID